MVNRKHSNTANWPKSGNRSQEPQTENIAKKRSGFECVRRRFHSEGPAPKISKSQFFCEPYVISRTAENRVPAIHNHPWSLLTIDY